MDSFAKSLDLEGSWSKLLNYFQTSSFWISLVILVVAFVLWKVLKHVRRKWKAKNGGMTTASNAAFDFARFLFFFLLVVVLLQINGVNVTGLITGLGVVSAIIGLALQDFLKDIIMGIHILSDKFFQVGDVVRYNGMEGVVISFNVRTTKLELIDYREVLTISNRNISEIAVISDMFDLDVELPYYIEANRIHETMKELEGRIAKLEGVKKSLYKGTQSFNDSSITYRMRYWTPPDSKRNDVRRAIIKVVQDGMNEAGIPFPYNHLDVEIVNQKNEDVRY